MTDTPSSAAPPPGWYAQSSRAARQRWWNGSEWTDHFRDPTAADATAPLSLAEAESVAPAAPLPATRAELRAARGAEVSAEPDLPAPAAVAASPTPRDVSRVAPPTDDWMPPPVVNRAVTPSPVAVTSGGMQRSTFVPVQRNPWATASIVITLVSGGVLALGAFWLDGVDPELAPLVVVGGIAGIVLALILAVVALVVAARQPTRRTVPVLALALAVVVAVASAVVLFPGR